MSEKNRKYQLDTQENRTFLKEVRESLLNFGHQFPASGGSSYYLGDDGTPWKDRPREAWGDLPHGACLQHRNISWTSGKRSTG